MKKLKDIIFFLVFSIIPLTILHNYHTENKLFPFQDDSYHYGMAVTTYNNITTTETSGFFQYIKKIHKARSTSRTTMINYWGAIFLWIFNGDPMLSLGICLTTFYLLALLAIFLISKESGLCKFSSIPLVILSSSMWLLVCYLDYTPYGFFWTVALWNIYFMLKLCKSNSYKNHFFSYLTFGFAICVRPVVSIITLGGPLLYVVRRRLIVDKGDGQKRYLAALLILVIPGLYYYGFYQETYDYLFSEASAYLSSGVTKHIYYPSKFPLSFIDLFLGVPFYLVFTLIFFLFVLRRDFKWIYIKDNHVLIFSILSILPTSILCNLTGLQEVRYYVLSGILMWVAIFYYIKYINKKLFVLFYFLVFGITYVNIHNLCEDMNFPIEISNPYCRFMSFDKFTSKVHHYFKRYKYAYKTSPEGGMYRIYTEASMKKFLKSELVMGGEVKNIVFFIPSDEYTLLDPSLRAHKEIIDTHNFSMTSFLYLLDRTYPAVHYYNYRGEFTMQTYSVLSGDFEMEKFPVANSLFFFSFSDDPQKSAVSTDKNDILIDVLDNEKVAIEKKFQDLQKNNNFLNGLEIPDNPKKLILRSPDREYKSEYYQLIPRF